MRRAAFCALAVGWTALCGCNWLAGPQPIRPISTAPPAGWKPLKITHVRLAVEKLGQIPNSGLLLPAVSPDGQWIAYLKTAPQAAASSQSLLTGKHLAGVALVLRRTRPGAAPKTICPSGAAWPTWSADGRCLAFVVAAEDGRCRIGLHDLAGGTTRRVSVGARWMIMPAVSPDAGRIAAAVALDVPGRSRLHLLDVRTAALSPAPAGQKTPWQLWPLWQDGGVVFLQRSGETAALMQWTPAEPKARRLTDLVAAEGMSDAFRLLAAVPRPLSPDGRRLAFYDMWQDRVRIADLSGGAARMLPPRTRAACWFGDDFLLAATDEELLLASSRGDQRKRLLRGKWLPLWADPRTRQVIVCTPGAEPWTFGLVRLRLISE